MELSTSRTFSKLPSHSLTHLQCKPTLILNKSPFNPASGLLYCMNSSIRSTTSVRTSRFTSQYVKDDGFATVEQEDDVAVQVETPTEDSSLHFQAQLTEFFDKVDIKFDLEDSSSIVLLGGGALVALWLSTAIVAAIDSIPLFPKVLEVVGLGYTLWFSTRFLIFKENRKEVVAKVVELKQQVLGSKEE